MSEDSDFDRRLRAVERALTDGDHDVAALRDAAAHADRLDDLEARIATLEKQIAELEAATQAVRGYVGNVRSVNEDVERRADAALGAIDRLEARLDADQTTGNTGRATTNPGRTIADDSPTTDSGPAESSTSGRPPTAAEGDASSVASTESPEADRYGIEMPPHGAHAPLQEVRDEADDPTSVIDRVREVL